MNASRLSWVVASSLLLIMGIRVKETERPGANESPVILNSLPAFLGEWKCSPVPAQEGKYVDPNVNEAWTGLCGRPGGHPIDVYFGYSKGSERGKKLLSPKANYPFKDSRWSYLSSRTVEISSFSKGTRPLYAGQVQLQHSTDQKVAVLYWFQLKDQSIPNEYSYRFSLMIQKLKNEEGNNGAIVRLAAPLLADDDDPEKVFSEEKDLARNLYPFILIHLP